MKLRVDHVRSAWLVAVALLGTTDAIALEPKRLSEWLLEQTQPADPYPLGLSWRVPEEEAAQSLLKRELLDDALRGADPADVKRLKDWLRALPVTGRVPVTLADPRWLEVHPERDPLLLPHHTVVLPFRPATVTVVTQSGTLCHVGHRAGVEALQYAEACDPRAAAKADWAWIAQPDGRAQRYGIRNWNIEPQNPPAPGSWIWAPSRDAGIHERFSERLIRFLGTQGPASDPPSGTLALTPSAAPEQFWLGSSRVSRPTFNDWGGVGLMQTPTARMAPMGTFGFSISHVYPYTRGNLFAQPFEWLEAGFRYTDISNRLYLPGNNNQTDKDKSIDAKVRLWTESAYIPEFAIGVRDIGGTGQFAGEYIVGSKRFGALDLSLGVGWGNIGARGDVRNPLGGLFPRFNTRGGNPNIQGGTVNLGNYFSGPAAFFGGLQYQTPWDGLVLKLEYDGNNYKAEPQNNPQPQHTALNVGLTYRLAKWAEVSLGIERGNQVVFGFALRPELDDVYMPKLRDLPRVPVVAPPPQQVGNWGGTAREIQQQTGWRIKEIDESSSELRVTLDEPEGRYWAYRIDRVTAVLNRDTPARIQRFVLVYHQRGFPTAEHVIDRETWLAQQVVPTPPHAHREPVVARAPRDQRPEAAVRREEKRVFMQERRRFEATLGFDWQQHYGAPDAFLLYQLSLAERMRLWISEDTWVRAKLRLGILNNYDIFKITGPTELPPVRTFLREYLVTSRFTMPLLQATHMGRLTHHQYYSVYGGYFEEMFGGVGAEWLYRPFASRAAFAVDVNYVKQREFEQKFAFRDYEIATGHGTLYYDTGWNDILATVSAGRYLAGDLGATLQVSRTFRNGLSMGAWATKTNVSAARFGEGSFDKGLFISIPFDAILARSSGSAATLAWRPLTRDGGAMLIRGDRLYDATSARSDRTLWHKAAPPPDDTVLPAERRDNWQPAPVVNPPYSRVPPKPPAERWAAGAGFELALEQALYGQGFRNIRIEYDASHRLKLALSAEPTLNPERAVGRAARTSLRHAPAEARELHVTLFSGTQPVATYEFIDVRRLERFLAGNLSRSEFSEYVAVRYADASRRPSEPLLLLNDLSSDEGARTLPEVAINTLPARSVVRAAEDGIAAARSAQERDWLGTGFVAGGIVLGSALLDNTVLRFSRDKASSPWMKAGVRVGDAVPFVALGGAALLALDGSDPVRSRTSFSAAEAGVTAIAATTGLKFLGGRARPGAGEGMRSFHPGSKEDHYQSFPSRHAAVAWAVATPYAQEYGTPWPYAAAAVTTLARAGSREHWLSDSVAGSLLGFGIGHLFWQSGRERHKDAPRMMLRPDGVTVGWDLP